MKDTLRIVSAISAASGRGRGNDVREFIRHLVEQSE